MNRAILELVNKAAIKFIWGKNVGGAVSGTIKIETISICKILKNKNNSDFITKPELSHGADNRT